MLIQGIAEILNIECLITIFVGVSLGIIFGCIPGLTAHMAMVLCLPLSFGMSSVLGTTLLVSLFIGGISGGCIAAILINIPGTPAAVATCFDGHPMAKRGEAGKALGVAILSSFTGGMFSVIVLIFLSPILARFALKFGPFEYAAVSIFSLTLISSLIGDSLIKGLISAFLGMGFATVGLTPIDCFPRMTFGLHSLDGGFDMVAVLIGLYAVQEVINAANDKELDDTKIHEYNMKGFGVSLKEFFSHSKNIFRSSAIGTGIGILPGLGASVANIVSYAAAKRSSDYPEKFGTGILDGIIASEVSNNATVGGAMVPLLSLGIPGDGQTALLLGALMIHGLVPGPMLFVNNLKFVYNIFGVLLIAHFAMIILARSGLKIFVSMLKTPKNILMPIVMMLCILGSFATNNRIFDVWCILFFGVIAYLFEASDIPSPPFVMAFILSPIIETNLRRGLMSSGGSFLPFITKPIALTFILISLIFLFFSIRKDIINNKKRKLNQAEF